MAERWTIHIIWPPATQRPSETLEAYSWSQQDGVLTILTGEPPDVHERRVINAREVADISIRRTAVGS